MFRRFSSVAKFGTLYFLLKLKILAKRKREGTTKFALERQRTDEVIARLEALAEQSGARRLLLAGIILF